MLLTISLKRSVPSKIPFDKLCSSASPFAFKLNHLGIALDQGQRRTQLMGGDFDEAGFRAVHLFQNV